MAKNTKFFVAVLMMRCAVEAKEDLDNIVKKMNERLSLTVEKLSMTQDELLRTKEGLKELEKEVSFLKDPPWTFACGAETGNLQIRRTEGLACQKCRSAILTVFGNLDTFRQS